MFNKTSFFFWCRWAESHHDELLKIGSSLEFNLRSMKYIQLISTVGTMEAIEYIRTYALKYGDKHFSGKYLQT